MIPAALTPGKAQARITRVAGSLLIFLFIFTLLAPGQQAGKVEVLHIGTSGTLAAAAKDTTEEDALQTLQSFIKAETGFGNDIVRQKDWHALAEKLENGQLHIGVFQGYEFAWARERHPKLQPLALAVNVHIYHTAHVVVRNDNKAADLAGLAGQSLALPRSNQGHLRLFVERQARAEGKELDTFFSKITSPDTIEDALDDVVDGVVQAAVVDRAGLEAYKRRKPGRFHRLKEATRSRPFPPPLVAYHEGTLDEATLRRFQEGLVNAKNKEKGERLLTLFRLTGFERVPKDFDQVLATMRKAYPPHEAK